MSSLVVAATSFKEMLYDSNQLPKSKLATSLTDRGKKLIARFPHLLSQYTFVGTIGTGRSGTVFEALSLTTERFAIKIGSMEIDPEYISVEQAVTRIEREVSIGKIAANANIGPKNYSHGLIEHAQGTIGHKIFF